MRLAAEARAAEEERLAAEAKAAEEACFAAEAKQKRRHAFQQKRRVTVATDGNTPVTNAGSSPRG